MESTTVLFQLEGLPFSVNKKDIQTFFRDSNLMEDDISILKSTEDDRCLGLAFVRFHTELEANVATRHCGVEIGGNRVAMKRTSFQDMVTTKQRLESVAANSHSTRRKISEPISVSPERKGLGLRSPTGSSHSANQRRSEERSKAIRRLPFQQIESAASVRESVERQRNRSRSPHRTRAGGSGSSYQSRGSPYGSHYEQASHRPEKVTRHQYGREEVWGEGPRETSAQQPRIDMRSSHLEQATWPSSSSRGSGRSDVVSERETRPREEPKRDTSGSSVYRAHQMGSSDGVDHLHYSGVRIREVEERKGHFRRRTHDLEVLDVPMGDRTVGIEDHRGYSGGRLRDIEVRGGRSGSRNNEVEVRGRQLGSRGRDVEVRGGRSGSRNREVEAQSGHSGSRGRGVEVRGGYLGNRNREVEVQSGHLGSRSREEHDYRGHLEDRDGDGRSGHSRELRERGDAVGYRSSLDRSRPSDDANSGVMSDAAPEYVVKLMGYPSWFAFKEIRHLLGRSVAVLHGGIHFVTDARRPTAFVTVGGEGSYENALKLDGLTIDKQSTLTVLGTQHPKRDKGRSEGDDLRRMLEKRREPKNHSSHDSRNKGSSFTSKHSDHSPVAQRDRHSPDLASRDHSYSPGRVQKLADEFWSTGSHSSQHAEYPATHAGEGVAAQAYPMQWQGENGHFVQGLPGYHATGMESQSAQHADYQGEGGFMEAAIEYPEYFTREELAYTGDRVPQPRYTAPFSSQPVFSEDYIALGGVPLDSMFCVPTSEGEDANLRSTFPPRRDQDTPPAPEGTLPSVVHVVHKGRDHSTAMPLEYSQSQGTSSGHGRVTGADTPTTVRCANLPTSVVVTDILGFLHDDTLSYDNVRIQCDDKGKPTGKCFITFPSQQQALRAVQRHSNQRLKNNKVAMELVL